MEMLPLIKMMTVLLSLIFILFIGILVVLAVALKGFLDNRKALLALKRYEINVSTFPFGDNIVEILNEFIEECFQEYKITHLVPNHDGTPVYVTDEREKEIREDLVQIVSSRLSPILLERLSLYYRADQIGSVIADKIYLTVMNYAIESRQVLEMTNAEKMKNFKPDQQGTTY